MLNLILSALPFICVAIALGTVGVLSFLAGRWQRNHAPIIATDTKELKRSQDVTRRMGVTANNIQSEVDQHQKALAIFNAELSRFEKGKEQEGRELSDAADGLLGPTLRLTRQLSNAYDELREQTNALQTLTDIRTDPLTGVKNRKALDETLEGLIARLARYGCHFSIAIFDIDNLNSLNEEHGHLHGDRILQDVAQFFDRFIRETDMVARYGGEEFIVLMPETDLLGASVFAERVRAELDAELATTISAGTAMAREGEDARTIIARADDALYESKNQGRNLVYEHDGLGLTPVTVAKRNKNERASDNKTASPTLAV